MKEQKEELTIEQRIAMYEGEIQKANNVINECRNKLSEADAVALRCEGAIAVLKELKKEMLKE